MALAEKMAESLDDSVARTDERIRKVVKTLSWIENRIGSLAQMLKLSDSDLSAPEREDDDERRMRELLLNGPQMKGEAISQDFVDGYFEKSDQDDIDALFS